MAGTHNDHAMRLLHNLGVEATEIVRVSSDESPEAVLFLMGRKPATAWLSRVDGKQTCRCEPGFPAFPRNQR